MLLVERTEDILRKITKGIVGEKNKKKSGSKIKTVEEEKNSWTKFRKAIA